MIRIKMKLILPFNASIILQSEVSEMFIQIPLLTHYLVLSFTALLSLAVDGSLFTSGWRPIDSTGKLSVWFLLLHVEHQSLELLHSVADKRINQRTRIVVQPWWDFPTVFHLKVYVQTLEVLNVVIRPCYWVGFCICNVANDLVIKKAYSTWSGWLIDV